MKPPKVQLPKIITSDFLQQFDICDEELGNFVRNFPDGFDVERDLNYKNLLELDEVAQDWILKNFYGLDIYNEYQNTIIFPLEQGEYEKDDSFLNQEWREKHTRAFCTFLEIPQ